MGCIVHGVGGEVNEVTFVGSGGMALVAFVQLVPSFSRLVAWIIALQGALLTLLALESLGYTDFRRGR